MNLTEMRARVREDLQDSTPADYHWTDDEVDGAVIRALWEYSLAAPIQKQSDLATTPASKEIDISTLSRLMKVDSIEFPIGQPKQPYIKYWAGRVYMADEGDGTNARVRWLQAHALDGSSTTVPAQHEEILVLGATGYLALSASAYTVDRASIAGRYGTMSYRAWGKERLARYDMQMKAVSAQNRVSQTTLYTEEA